MSVKFRLTLMNFMQFFIWGSWLITIGVYWFQNKQWSGAEFGVIFSTMGISSIFMPAITGIISDRFINEQDADMVLFLYRPEYYGITEDEQGRSQAGIGEVIIAKHRNGETGIVPLRFIGKYVKFTDLEDSFAPPTSFSMDNPGAGMAPSQSFERPSGNVIIRPSKMDDMHDEDAPF